MTFTDHAATAAKVTVDALWRNLLRVVLRAIVSPARSTTVMS